MSYRAAIALSFATLASVALAACSDSNEPDNNSSVRVANASASTSGLNATDDEDEVLASGVNFQNSNADGCSAVQTGSRTVSFTAGSPSVGVGSLDFTSLSLQEYTIVFFGTNNASVLLDVFSNPPSGSMAIRFVNATGSAGDIYLTTPTGAVAAPPTIANLPAGQVSGFNSTTAPGGTFVNYPLANTRVRLFNVGTTTGTPRADFTISNLPANNVATVILTPAPSGGSTTGFLVATCAS